MIDKNTAIKEAKDLAEFCENQFCPECVFNKGTCLIGELDCYPRQWNAGHVLDNIEGSNLK